MPSGRTHDRLTWWSTAAAALALLTLTRRGDWALALALGSLFGGLMFSADLDTVSRPLRRWGPLAWIWTPYRWLVPHRASHSHGLVWGPLFRGAYAVVVLSLLVVGLLWGCEQAGWRVPADLIRQGLRLGWDQAQGLGRGTLLLGLAGIVWANFVHVAADVGVSALKRRR